MSDIKITCLGHGGAFTTLKDGGNSAFLIEVGGGRLLFDCGRTVPDALSELEIPWESLDAIYISHLHSDHIGGLETSLFHRHFVHSAKEKLKLYAADDVLRDLWPQSLKGGMQYQTDKLATLETYVDPQPVFEVSKHVGFTFGGALCVPEPMYHIDGRGWSMPCYGLSIYLGNKAVWISGDGISGPQDYTQWDKYNLILHECDTRDVYPDVRVHTHLKDLEGLSAEARGKTFLYHNNGQLPDRYKDQFSLCEKGREVTI